MNVVLTRLQLRVQSLLLDHGKSKPITALLCKIAASNLFAESLPAIPDNDNHKQAGVRVSTTCLILSRKKPLGDLEWNGNDNHGTASIGFHIKGAS